MCLRMYMRVYGYELTIGMHMRMCIYVCVHIGAKTYLRGYVQCVCVCDCMYFVREPLIPHLRV